MRIRPDFIAELRSESDTIGDLRKKMRVDIAQGVRLGWPFDPIRGRVETYRPGREVEMLDHPRSLSGEGILSGFILICLESWAIRRLIGIPIPRMGLDIDRSDRE